MKPKGCVLLIRSSYFSQDLFGKAQLEVDFSGDISHISNHPLPIRLEDPF